jgi:histidinol-phosphate aminotransferase
VVDWDPLVRPSLPGLEPYRPGASVSELKVRYGLDEVVKLNWNENLFGPLPGVLDAVQAELEHAWMYPEQAYADFRDDVARAVGTSPERVVPGHGTQALIGTVAAAFVRPGDDVVVPELTYGLYAQVSAAYGAVVHRVPLRGLDLDLAALAESARATSARLVWVCDPNNPTGATVGTAAWEDFLEALPPGCAVVVDEAYVDYVPPERRVARERDVEAGRPVVALRSFSKLYGLAGLRLGFAIADESLATHLHVVQEPFNVNRAALAAGRACLRDPAAADERRREVADARDVLARGLRDAGAEPVPSATNFVLARVDVDDLRLVDELARRGLLIRAGSELGLPGYVRVTVGPAPVMARVAEELGEVRAALRDGR